MKSVYFLLKDPKEASGLAEKLRESGIKTKLRDYGGAEDILQTDRDDLPLIVTDSGAAAAWCLKSKIPCLGYENNEEVRFQGLPMVIQGFDEIDADFLAIVYNRSMGIPVVIAQTERLIIRELAVSDLDTIYDLYSQPGACSYMPGLDSDREREREKLAAYIRNMYPLYEYGLWALIDKHSGRMIGQAGLENKEYRGNCVVELGYMVDREYQRRGLAYEACSEIICYAREVLGLEEIYAFIDPENTASLRLAEKMSFVFLEKSEKEGLCVYIKKSGT